ncbi:MAG TPA: hypothetical protein VIF62_18255, partial [Labilithrix sp.]
HDDVADPTRIAVSGVAKTAYSLDVTVAGYHVTTKIPAGSSPEATAKLVAAALDAANEKIMETIGADATYAPLGGDHAESPSGVDDLEISTDGAAVTLFVALNG